MQISYIPKNVPNNPLGNLAMQKQLEDTISNAIKNTIVIPFIEWITDVSVKLLYASEWCLVISMACGIVIRIVGIKKGEKIAIVSFLIYIGIQVVKMAVVS